MFEVFKYVDKFFTSLTNYLTYNDIFIIFVGLFLLSTIVVLISTANAYEAKLIKAIDKFNAYFIDNPQINEENLVAFNQKMKARFVPKQLRKSWQQFVLYRENKASAYMSFENCVSNPIKNSSYKRDTKLMSFFSYIFAFCALILNCYYCYETADLASILSSVLLTPIIILLLNYIMQIFFKVKHSAIVSDLFQNYQYFEVNIDKATETLPEYVDYEVLFDRNEIKKGIPILYAYLQKRAEEEQRELERARLKNVEHEQFNFDDAGVEASLVLERAMQEAENYIAERKKYNQDTAQINDDITQEDMNYREITKEYNRQMQVSRETFANFKSQLEEVSSSIEANYLKKQQQQELDRQRNLERDFDTATDRHKKIIESYQDELDSVDKFIAQSRKSLEDAMKSEFSTYSSKVYEEAKKVVEEREKEKFNKLKAKIEELEEEIVAKNNELTKVYNENQAISEQLSSSGVQVQPVSQPQPQPVVAPVEDLPEVDEDLSVTEPVEEEFSEPVEEVVSDETQPVEDFAQEIYDDNVAEDEFAQEEPVKSEYVPLTYEEPEEYSYGDYDNNETEYDVDNNYDDNYSEGYDDNYSEGYDDNYSENYDENAEESAAVENFEDFEEVPYDEKSLEEFANRQDNQNLRQTESQNISTEQTEESIKEVKPASRRGRPRKVVDVEQGEKRGRGRPKKVEVEEKQEQPKRSVGRPRKIEETKPVVTEEKRGRGRPRKEEKVVASPVKKGRGRPKKVQSEVVKQEVKKAETASAPVKKGRGRPKKVETTQPEVKQTSRGRGRPRKDVSLSIKSANNIDDIDEYLKQIDNAIAEENAKMEETQKELSKNAKLKRKK